MRIKVLVTFLVLVTFFSLLAGAAVIMPLFSYKVIASDIESKESVMNRNNTGLILLDRSGKVFYKFYQGRHLKPTPLAQIPEVIQEAVLAAEDKEFYDHPGYSIRATVAALIANIRKGENIYGGSTITQQLVKNSLLNPEKDFQRKYQEIILAKQLEERFSKDEILEMYLNSAYFGEGAFGVEEAVKVYFSLPLQDISLAQASLLAAILVAPSHLSPISGDKEAALARQKIVLKNMQEQGYITEEERVATEDAAQKIELNLNPENTLAYQAPHFALMVRQELIDKYGEEQVTRSGFIVHTTIDLSWQAEAERIVNEQLIKLANKQASNSAAVVLDPKTGEIRAMVGSRDWQNPDFGKVNVALALRQPGSSFKPLVYLAGLEKQAITPATILNDKPTTFGKNYRPENYDRRYRGRVMVRRSLANSLNIPTVELQQKIGVATTLDLAKRLGISTLGKFSASDLSVSLGSGETRLLDMTNAYATLANKGMRHTPTTIAKIIDKHDKVVYQLASQAERVIDERYTYVLSSILSDNEARKEIFGNALTINRPAAVKTGTSQDYKDSWTLGYTPSLAIGVWVGNNDGRPMDKVAGSLGAAPIWRNLMEKFLATTPIERFEKPAGVVEMKVCKSNGLKANENTPPDDLFSELFIEGTEPILPCFVTPSPTPSPSPTIDLLLEIPLNLGGDPNGIIQPLVTSSATPNSDEDQDEDAGKNKEKKKELIPSPTPSPTPDPRPTPIFIPFP